MKKSPPSTSLDAYKSIDPEHLRKMYKDILYVLGQMPNGGSYEDISIALKIKESRVWKRLGEMERMDLIHRDGRKTLSSGRQGSIWRLWKNNEILKREKFPPGKTAHEHAKSIIQQAQLF